MENFNVYGRHAKEHAERTEIENLSEGFEKILNRFNRKTQNESILEVGCGSGRDLRYLHQVCGRNTESYGLDASSRMISLARENTHCNDVSYVVGDMANLPFDDATFGGLWCQATIFMTGKAGMEATLNEFRRVMTDNGVGVVSFKLEDGKSDDNGRQMRKRWGEKVKYYFVDEGIVNGMMDSASLNPVETDRSEFKHNVFLNVWFES